MVCISLLKKLDPHVEQRLLDEYTELGFCWRHDDDWIAKLTAVFAPAINCCIDITLFEGGRP